ncbi:Pentatricopeptide repeat-containing protein [Melia azedarach]|uniref:Pentatricopeptide repeat-containing protein n=1 Tax=Melia azedarach TaxID=155640 RepID=A0ACC1YKW4_MELAZ|nr:Pentatricopeptide repeat-containing protein [Melia azedarach]
MICRQIQTLIQRPKTAIHLQQLNSLFIKTCLDHDVDTITHFIVTSLSISLSFARSFFNNLPVSPPLFAYNSLIRAYTKTSFSIESIKLLDELLKVGIKPDNFTYPSVLKACGQCSQIGLGGSVHSMIFKVGLDSDKYVGNTLLRMYAACNEIGLAKEVFDEMTLKDLVSWSSMLAGYVACDRPMQAFKVFQQMKLANERPNSVTLVSLLSACTSLINFRAGESIHSYAITNGMALDVALGTALIEMYSKCGDVEKASIVFSSMCEKNLQSWTIMISGLADNSRGKDAISLFTKMIQTGQQPDSMSFSAILSACSHLGLVEEGKRYFDEMVRTYDIKPTMEHYGCLVDLLGRAGLIEEAYYIIRNMPMEPNAVILRSFLGACRNHGQVLCLDDNMRELLLELEPELGANYVLASSVSSVSGYWNYAADLMVSMKQKGLKKVPGCSRVEVNGCSAKEIQDKAVD